MKRRGWVGGQGAVHPVRHYGYCLLRSVVQPLQQCLQCVVEFMVSTVREATPRCVSNASHAHGLEDSRRGMQHYIRE
jgi:hypothetical protein